MAKQVTKTFNAENASNYVNREIMMSKYLHIPNRTVIQLSDKSEELITQLINAYFLSNSAAGLENNLIVINKMIDAFLKSGQSSWDICLEYGIEFVSKEQSLAINRQLLGFDLLSDKKLQQLANLLFESQCFFGVQSGTLQFTNLFFQWIDKQMLDILILNKDVDDKVLRRLASSYNRDNQNRISKTYFYELLGKINAENCSVTFH